MNFLHIQPFIEKTLKKLGLNHVADASELRYGFEKLAPEILGEELFEQTEFLFFKNKTLYLGAKSHHWAQHLFVQRHNILEAMQSNFPEFHIRAVHVQAKTNQNPS